MCLSLVGAEAASTHNPFRARFSTVCVCLLPRLRECMLGGESCEGPYRLSHVKKGNSLKFP